MSRNTKPYDVNERTIFITGAARGIGAETARRLHAKGANVALIGLEPERLERLAAQLGNDRAFALEVDVTDYDALQRAVNATVERFGAIDVGIANAGIAFTGPLATARRMLSEPDRMTEAMHIAEFSHETDTQDPLLGVAMQAVEAGL